MSRAEERQNRLHDKGNDLNRFFKYYGELKVDKFKGGYFWNILRVDLTSGRIHEEEFDQEFAQQYIGGLFRTFRTAILTVNGNPKVLGPSLAAVGRKRRSGSVVGWIESHPQGPRAYFASPRSRAACLLLPTDHTD